jgi:GTPase SAR1 family protein
MNNSISNSNLSNPQLDTAFDYVVKTNRSVFLTGKAGTGKTTFLKRLKLNTPKRITIVAPTGVAAINAGGVTIHSLFQLPFSPFLPNHIAVEAKKFSREKINLIKSIDLLVIDEISMVRCDVLDAIDSVLRQFRNRYKPFGGVQLLLIGDINQLAPVAKDDEWQLLSEFYETVFFFSSKSLKEDFPVIVELKHIFRQKDRAFIDLLNKVRNNQMDDEAYHLLNQRLNPEIFNNNEDDGYITLTSHNYASKQINSDKLARIEEKSYFFKASITGDFSEYSYPTDENLELKIGAQVMFIRNDTGKEKRFFNGKIGKVIRIDKDNIIVATDEQDFIEVGREDWKNIKYSLNPKTKTIEEKEIGSFGQFPLKLAYAITIHKSQGLTFDKVIIDAQAAFSSGQVYVALSRCRTLEGIVLSTPISNKSIRLDFNIHQFNQTIAQENLSDIELQKCKFDYQLGLILDLLDFSQMEKPLIYLRKTLADNSPPMDSASINLITEIITITKKDIGLVMSNFKKQIESLLLNGVLPENNDFLLERLRKASSYFEDKIQNLLVDPLKSMQISTENKTIQEAIGKALTNVHKVIYVKQACFKYCSNAFIALDFVHCRVNAEIDFESTQKRLITNSQNKVSRMSKHPDLYVSINELRKRYASENGVDDYQIFTLKALLGIANNLPIDFKSLEKINGIGKVTSKRFGFEIIETVKQYCEKNNLTPPPLIEEVKVKKTVGETFKISLDLFKEGKTIKEIAALRTLNISTIYGHLGRFVNSGDLGIVQIIPAEKIQRMDQLFNENPDISLVDAKTQMGDNISFEELRLYRGVRFKDDSTVS